MTDQELLECFEGCALPVDGFHHGEHIRLARAYLARYPVLKVLEKMSSGLAALARARGRPDHYHETITRAFVFLVRERMLRDAGEGTWEEFAAKHADLLDWKNNILRSYYRDATLASAVARTSFLLPDRRAD